MLSKIGKILYFNIKSLANILYVQTIYNTTEYSFFQDYENNLTENILYTSSQTRLIFVFLKQNLAGTIMPKRDAPVNLV